LAVGILGASFPEGLQPLLLKGFGGILVVGICCLLSKGTATPTEVKLYFAFVSWAVLSAILVAADANIALMNGWTVFQLGLLFWGVTLAHVRDPDLRITMWGFWGLGILLALLAYLNPEAMALIRGGGKAYERLSATGENPNATGQVFVFATFAALYLAQRAAPWFVKIAVLSAVPAFVFMLLYSGSRKMSVAIVIVVAAWLLTSMRVRATQGRVRAAYVLTILGIAATAMVVSGLWEETPMAKRWEVEMKGYGGGSADRIELAREGFDLFLEHPVAGVGLQNQVLTMGSVSHSEYVDVLASTGIVGACLYFPIYFIAFRRARRASRSRPSRGGTEWQAFVTYVVLLAWLMVGFTRFDDLCNLLVMGAFIGYFQAGDGKVHTDPARAGSSKWKHQTRTGCSLRAASRQGGAGTA
jgi:O-antigen ligase